MRAVFIRHGESTGNFGIPCDDLARITLTKKGLRQARKVAEAWTEPPSLIVTSPYLRTQQTAAPTIERFPSVCCCPREQELDDICNNLLQPSVYPLLAGATVSPKSPPGCSQEWCVFQDGAVGRSGTGDRCTHHPNTEAYMVIVTPDPASVLRSGTTGDGSSPLTDTGNNRTPSGCSLLSS